MLGELLMAFWGALEEHVNLELARAELKKLEKRWIRRNQHEKSIINYGNTIAMLRWN